MRINRSQVGKHTGDTKTEGSGEGLPIHEDLYAILEAWREEQAVEGIHTTVNRWLFGSLVTGLPFCRGTLQKAPRQSVPAPAIRVRHKNGSCLSH